MKVFISWSGGPSKEIAQFLHDWLPSVLQNIKPYMSAENIDKGERWSRDIASQLQETNYGIICVTPDNKDAPWILFESGALSKSIENARVSPVIFGLTPSDLSKSPLLQFQLTSFNQSDIRKLVVSINNSALENEKIGMEVLERSFSRAWKELEAFVLQKDFSVKNEAQSLLPIEETKLSKNLEIAIEEILTNSRSQIKILNSPKDILPPGYLYGVLQEARLLPTPFPRSHPAWNDLETAISSLYSQIELEFNDEFISSLPSEEEKIAYLDRRKSASVTQDRAQKSLSYIFLKLYGPRLGFRGNRSPSLRRREGD